MTILGKILVILNFVFSLVTAALIVMVFLTRTNWHSAYDDLNKKYTVLQTSASAYTQEIDATKKACDTQVELRDRKIQELTAAVDQQKKALAVKDDNLLKFQADEAATKAAFDKATQDLKRRETEVANLMRANDDKDKKINDLEGENQGFRDRAVAAEINYRSEHERNRQLLDRNVQLSQDLQKAQGTSIASGNGRVTTSFKRPPEDVKGRIVDVDAKSGLATISIGSDSGVSVGHALEVYRMKPKPEYVGTVRVVDVHFKQAVVRPVIPLRAGPLQTDDTVASRIVAGTTNR